MSPALQAALPHLPALYPFGSLLTFIIIAASLVGVATYGIARLLTNQHKRRLDTARDAHWTTRARALYPLKIATLMTPVIGGGVGLVGILYSGPLSWASPLTTALLGALACVLASLPARRHLERLANPSATGHDTLVGALVLYPHLTFCALGALLCPAPLGWASAAAAALTGGLIVLWVTSVGQTLKVKLGLLQRAGPGTPAFDAVNAVTDEIPAGGVYTTRWSAVNAVAFPQSRAVAFTHGILARLNAEELAAVAAHEVGHLNEPGWARALRVANLLVFVPLVATRPMTDAFGFEALIVLLLLPLLVLAASRVAFKRLETHADDAATDHSDEATYARALEKVYQANAMPAVMAASSTHPNLYDRMQRAGVTPPYPRPTPPDTRLFHGLALTALLAIILTLGATRVAAMVLPAFGLDDTQRALLSSTYGGDSHTLARLGASRLDTDPDAATDLLYAAHTLAPDDPEIALHLTRAAAQAHRCELAEQTLPSVPADGVDAARRVVETCAP